MSLGSEILKIVDIKFPEEYHKSIFENLNISLTCPEIAESKDLVWGRTCAVDSVRARGKGCLANRRNSKFHLIGVCAIPRIFPAILAWNMFGPGVWARNC